MVDTSEFFRSVNDRTRKVEGTVRVSEIVCECADERCARTIRLRFDEYDALRAHPHQFAVVPGHERESSGEVVGRNPRYVLIRTRPRRAPPGERGHAAGRALRGRVGGAGVGR